MSARLAAALAALNPAAHAAVLRQLNFVSGLDDQLELVNEAWLLSQAFNRADEISIRLRDRMMRAHRDQRVANHAGSTVELVELVDTADPASTLEAAQAAHAWCAAAATICNDSSDVALNVAEAARRAGCCLRSVESWMRERIDLEQAGQLVLPGMPTTAVVYRSRRRAADVLGDAS